MQGKLFFTTSLPIQKFIYGGDSCDKGSGDLRIITALVDFKNRHDRDVTLLAGNRDIKCRRFTYELSHNVRQRLLHGAPAFWSRPSTPRQYVIDHMTSKGISAVSSLAIQRYLESIDDQACQTLYLKWMLEKTMGCGSSNNKPSTFEYRRVELGILEGKSAGSITDEMVTQSFIDSVSSDGIMTRYLKQSQLGAIIGDTLYIHGAVTIDNMGYVPGMSESRQRTGNAREWIEQLNGWYREQINEWLRQPMDDNLSPPGHMPLDQYVVSNPRSIVTTNWYAQGRLSPIDDRVAKFLNDSGICRVVSGHQPFSDFPLIIRQPNLEVIVGDTSYSDPSAQEDNRGVAIHNLEIVQLNNQSYATIVAIRKDGSTMHLDLLPPKQYEQDEDISIGHFTKKNQLIRPGLDSQLVASQLKGRTLFDEPLSADGVRPTKC
jgi:hypothetical protein